jgi:hypothetical protein
LIFLNGQQPDIMAVLGKGLSATMHPEPKFRPRMRLREQHDQFALGHWSEFFLALARIDSDRCGAFTSRSKICRKGISSGPTHLDNGRLNRSKNDRGREKPSGQCKMTRLSAVMQTWPKFGHGMHHRGIVRDFRVCLH